MQTMKVSGMTCEHCAKAVTAAVRTIDPEATVTVDLATGNVRTNSAAPRPAIAAAIEDAGYRVEMSP
jgi:copper chaperone